MAYVFGGNKYDYFHSCVDVDNIPFAYYNTGRRMKTHLPVCVELSSLALKGRVRFLRETAKSAVRQRRWPSAGFHFFLSAPAGSPQSRQPVSVFPFGPRNTLTRYCRKRENRKEGTVCPNEPRYQKYHREVISREARDSLRQGQRTRPWAEVSRDSGSRQAASPYDPQIKNKTATGQLYVSMCATTYLQFRNF